MDNTIHRVGSGLRRMKIKPDSFLVISSEQWAWDEDLILGIPVFHSCFVSNDMTDSDIPFIPIWKNDGDYILDRRGFNEGYENN